MFAISSQRHTFHLLLHHHPSNAKAHKGQRLLPSPSRPNHRWPIGSLQSHPANWPQIDLDRWCSFHCHLIWRNPNFQNLYSLLIIQLVWPQWMLWSSCIMDTGFPLLTFDRKNLKWQDFNHTTTTTTTTTTTNNNNNNNNNHHHYYYFSWHQGAPGFKAKRAKRGTSRTPERKATSWSSSWKNEASFGVMPWFGIYVVYIII